MLEKRFCVPSRVGKVHWWCSAAFSFNGIIGFDPTLHFHASGGALHRSTTCFGSPAGILPQGLWALCVQCIAHAANQARGPFKHRKEAGFLERVCKGKENKISDQALGFPEPSRYGRCIVKEKGSEGWQEEKVFDKVAWRNRVFHGQHQHVCIMLQCRKRMKRRHAEFQTMP